MRSVGIREAALAAAIAVIAGAAQAGQEPYIAVVGDDYTANGWYISEKLQHWLHPNTDFLAYCSPTGVGDLSYTRIKCPPGESPVEFFAVNNVLWHQYGSRRPEVCDPYGYWHEPTGSVSEPSGSEPGYRFQGNWNGLITAGNAGVYTWGVVLPKKPVSNLNLVLQCGVLKPDSFAIEGFNAIWVCAGETGERVGGGLCVRQFVPNGANPISAAAQPTLIATAFAGPYSPATGGFNLSAFRVPGTFGLTGAALTALTGGTDDRIHLKACMSESVIVKMPIRTFVAPGAGLPEFDLTQGDRIFVSLKFPRGHTMDVYCNWESLKIEGLGEPETLLP